LRERDGQVLKQSVADDGRLDEDVVSVELAPDGVAVSATRGGGAGCRLAARRVMSDIQKW